MPPKAKISKEMIVNAAVDVARKSGADSINARTVSQELNCSTQPVMYHFATIEELKKAAYSAADEYHTNYLLNTSSQDDPMLGIGLNYIHFAVEEPNLFRFLFQTDKFGGKDIETLLSAPDLSDILKIMADGLKVDTKQARQMFLTFFCVAHGLASLLANNSMEYDEEQCGKMLENVFFGMVASKKGK